MSTTVDSKHWVICPVCQQPNPAGTWLCEHCWGAALPRSPAFSLSEARAISKQRLSQLKRRKIRKIVTISLSSVLIIAVAVFLWFYLLTDAVSKPPQSVNSNSLPGEWAMFHHDLNRSGTTGIGGSSPRGKVKWVFPTGSAISSSPAVAYGTIYIGSRDNKLYALDATSGAKRWEFPTDSWVESSPSVAGGMVYFGSNDGTLYALDASNGQKLWSFKTNYAITSAPTVTNGIVYFGGDDYYLYALNAVTGTKLWSFNTKGIVKSSPAVANGIIYTGSGTDFSYALDTRDGKLRLRFKTLYPVYSSPVVNENIVYFIHSDGYLFAIDGYARSWPREHNITPYWRQAWLMGIPGISEPPPQSGLLWGLKIGSNADSSPVIANDTLYTGSDNKLLAIDLRTQKKLWEFKTGGSIRSSPAVVDATIYVGSTDGQLYAVDAANGQKLWDIPTGDMITSSPAVADGIIYFGSYDGKVYAIE
ncbi:MAG: PQQ-like beta-propeller repeat protein [Chloroflexi bacterium]|nr:PQQ-like beta-propeller repeat protein [Chloroflexota bacterium]